ncbi:diaminopimelate epimerase [uncultured Sphingomonas sp.]|uniref:diaminopimelate epimerase n=1 Tax=uncultured Sphingomonas sp. TaxID=158754 RepID=UPI0035CC82E9
MRVDLVKCHGSGNDFPLIDARGTTMGHDDWAIVARALADRAGPVGGDGLLLLGDGDAAHDFAMTMFNSDGSEAETCLNGLRCVARAGFAALGIDRATVRLKASSVMVERVADLAPGVFTVAETAGPVDVDTAAWVRAARAPGAEAPIAGLPSARAFVAAKIPNPHLVAFVDRLDEEELSAIGRFAEAAPPLLPERANVSFVEMRGADTIFVRTFERGVGLTDSCGSAMAVSSWAACHTGRTRFDRDLTVLNAGGRIGSRVARDRFIRLTGNATWEWRGSIEVNLATGLAHDLAIDTHFCDEIGAWARVADQAATTAA